MDDDRSLDFDFQFGKHERGALLHEARKVVVSYREELAGVGAGDTRSSAPSASDQAALALLEGFDEAVADFAAYPDVMRVEEQHFTEHGLKVPPRFQDLSKQFRFYWIRFPTVLKPATGTVFNKLQCAIQFNPGAKEPHLLPRAAMIMPDRKFQKLLGADVSLEVSIGEDFEFAAKTVKLEAKTALGELEASAGAKGSLVSKVGVVAGPFNYVWKKALVQHTAPGAEKVFWTLSSSQFSESDELAFIVVLQVPIEQKKVDVVAVLRAYHQLNLAASVGEAFKYFGKRLRDFCNAGAPTDAPTAKWNLTPSL